MARRRPDPEPPPAPDYDRADAEFLGAMERLGVDTDLDTDLDDRSDGAQPTGVPDPSRRTSGPHPVVRLDKPPPSRDPDAPLPESLAVRPGHALPSDPPSRRRLRKGRKRPPRTVEARLDLHGASVEQAIDRLDLFLVRAAAAGQRRVLVITGRGRGSAGGESVLRRAALHWLRHEGRSRVEQVAKAPPELGGSGALVILLRRGRRR